MVGYYTAPKILGKILGVSSNILQQFYLIKSEIFE